MTSEEVLFLELEEFKNAISDKFANEFKSLLSEVAKLKEENSKIAKENEYLIKKVASIEQKINTKETNNVKSLNQSVFSQPATATSFASNIFTFDNNKINQSLNPISQNKNSKRTYSNIVSDTNNGDSRPSLISHNPSDSRNQPKQRRLHVFDSTDPNAESRPFNPNSAQEFKTAGKRPNKGHHKSKVWLKSVGTKESGEFKVAERLCTIYIGRVSMDMDTPNISSLLTSMNISFSSLKQLETNHKKFKSFTFDINYLDKDIIYKKELWPRGLIVNRYFFNKNSIGKTVNQTTTNIQNQVASTSSAKSVSMEISSMAQINSATVQKPVNNPN